MVNARPPVPDRSLSIVIPTLNAAATLGPVLAACAKARAEAVAEIILVDGGSRDGTVAVARAAFARVQASRRPASTGSGRG